MSVVRLEHYSKKLFCFPQSPLALKGDGPLKQ